MRARIVKIGNSQGIRIPKPLLKESGIDKEIDLKVENNRLIITPIKDAPIKDARKGWDKAFSTINPYIEDSLNEYQNISNQWDETEWQW
ncbi:MAG: AbrB/MazE/SpoVT family DNA-binding domain-containing protein [Desulfobacterales bacterium]|nr:AbrB/MazE/SpoVT family DNA-binding domain-containing protein [Desulfobacterales bacterium]